MKRNKSAAIPASLSALCAVSSASAVIVHFDNSHSFNMGSGGNFQVDWDIDDDGNTDFRLQHYVNTNNQQLLWLRAFKFVGTAISNGSEAFVGGTNTLYRLATGYIVSAGAAFNNTTPAQFVDNYLLAGGLQEGQNYIGFRFLDDGDSGTVLYGWANINVSNSSNTFQMTEWAYETSGGSIEVGATVPEPASVALGLGALSLGAAGLRRWRKSKCESEAGTVSQ